MLTVPPAPKKKITSFEELLETIKAEFGERSVKQILTKLPIAEEVVRQKGRRKHHLWATTRIKILLAILADLVLPGRYADILQRTGYQEYEIYPFRKTLILEGVLKQRFVKRKRELCRQALQQIAETDIDSALKAAAVRVLTQVVTQRHYFPNVKSMNILAAIAIKAAAELLAHEIPTTMICRLMGCSYLPKEKVKEFLNVMKNQSRTS